MSWLQLLYSKSVRDLVQWSLCFLRDPQALSSTLAALRILYILPRAFESLKMRRDLGLSLYNYYVEVHSASQRAEREVAMSSHVHMHNKKRMEMKTIKD